MALVSGGVSAQEATSPTGYLVVVPQSIAVGQTSLVVGFHVEPHDLAVKIEYSDHFTPEGESCAGTSGGATQSKPAPTWIHLTACTAGNTTVKLVASETGAVIEQVDVTIAERPAVAGAVGEGGETVQISSAPSRLRVGQGGSFTVSA